MFYSWNTGNTDLLERTRDSYSIKEDDGARCWLNDGNLSWLCLIKVNKDKLLNINSTLSRTIPVIRAAIIIKLESCVKNIVMISVLLIFSMASVLRRHSFLPSLTSFLEKFYQASLLNKHHWPSLPFNDIILILESGSMQIPMLHKAALQASPFFFNLCLEVVNTNVPYRSRKRLNGLCIPGTISKKCTMNLCLENLFMVYAILILFRQNL